MLTNWIFSKHTLLHEWKPLNLRVLKNSFQSTGLIPFAPERVISKLNIRLTTPTPTPL
jgi:hypothetical protein